jgi:hypothetical protein
MEMKMKTEELERILMSAKEKHLTDLELEQYLTTSLDQVVMMRATAHLEGCLICRERLALLEEEQATLRQEATPEDVAMMRRLLTEYDRGAPQPEPGILSRLHARLKSVLESVDYAFGLRSVPGLATFSTSREPLVLESEDERVGVTIFEEENGDLVVRVGVETTKLEGTSVHLSAGNWEHTARLGRVGGPDEDWVGFRLVIPREQREEIRADTHLRITLGDVA